MTQDGTPLCLAFWDFAIWKLTFEMLFTPWKKLRKISVILRGGIWRHCFPSGRSVTISYWRKVQGDTYAIIFLVWPAIAIVRKVIAEVPDHTVTIKSFKPTWRQALRLSSSRIWVVLTRCCISYLATSEISPWFLDPRFYRRGFFQNSRRRAEQQQRIISINIIRIFFLDALYATRPSSCKLVVIASNRPTYPNRVVFKSSLARPGR